MALNTFFFLSQQKPLICLVFGNSFLIEPFFSEATATLKIGNRLDWDYFHIINCALTFPLLASAPQ